MHLIGQFWISESKLGLAKLFSRSFVEIIIKKGWMGAHVLLSTLTAVQSVMIQLKIQVKIKTFDLQFLQIDLEIPCKKWF